MTLSVPPPPLIPLYHHTINAALQRALMAASLPLCTRVIGGPAIPTEQPREARRARSEERGL